MTSNDPITGLLDQLAAYREQVTRLDTREAEHHTALSGQLAELTDQAAGISRTPAGLRGHPHPAHRNQPADAEPDGYRPDRRQRGGSWRPTAATSRSPGCGPGWSRSTGPATGTWPHPSAPAGISTTCACTGSTSWPSCGRCCTCSPAAAPRWCRPRPNTRPASCPSWPTSSGSRPTAAATPAAPHRPAASPGAGHDRRDAPPGPGLRRPRLAGISLPAPARRPPPPPHGYRDATTDPEQITAWFTRNPHWNLAIATGAPGPDVLDVDDHGPAGNGYAAFAKLSRAGLLDGAAAYVRTPSGGLHAYFRGSAQRNGHLPAHHLDFRSRGGYVLAPPSQVDGKPYQLIRTVEADGGLDWAAVTAPAGTPAADHPAPAAPSPRP